MGGWNSFSGEPSKSSLGVVTKDNARGFSAKHNGDSGHIDNLEPLILSSVVFMEKDKMVFVV